MPTFGDIRSQLHAIKAAKPHERPHLVVKLADDWKTMADDGNVVGRYVADFLDRLDSKLSQLAQFSVTNAARLLDNLAGWDSEELADSLSHTGDERRSRLIEIIESLAYAGLDHWDLGWEYVAARLDPIELNGVPVGELIRWVHVGTQILPTRQTSANLHTFLADWAHLVLNEPTYSGYCVLPSVDWSTRLLCWPWDKNTEGWEMCLVSVDSLGNVRRL